MGKIGDELQRRGLSNDELIQLLIGAQDSLIKIIEKADASSPFRSYRFQQVKAIDLVVKKMTAKTYNWSQKEIPKLLRAGESETKEEIKKLNEPDFELKFAGVNESAVRVLAEDSFLEFGNTMAALRRNSTKALMNKRKIAEKLVESVAQGSSVARTQKQLIDILKSDGIDVLKAKNGFGRRFSLEHYTNMLVRTQSMTAYNIGAKQQMLGTGRRFAVFPTIRPDIDGDDICNDWEKKKYVDLLKDPVPPQSTHPNCRHNLLPASFEELKAERPDLYQQAIDYWKKTANE